MNLLKEKLQNTKKISEDICSRKDTTLCLEEAMAQGPEGPPSMKFSQVPCLRTKLTKQKILTLKEVFLRFSAGDASMVIDC